MAQAKVVKVATETGGHPLGLEIPMVAIPVVLDLPHVVAIREDPLVTLIRPSRDPNLLRRGTTERRMTIEAAPLLVVLALEVTADHLSPLTRPIVKVATTTTTMARSRMANSLPLLLRLLL